MKNFNNRKNNNYSLEGIAAKSGMCGKTARKYLKIGKLPSELKKPRSYRTRTDPFTEHNAEIESMIGLAPGLQVKTLLYYLMERHPGQYNESHLRSLQRKIRDLKVVIGEDKEVIFAQDIQPGRQSQSDWTRMSDLSITIGHQPFDHMLFHFMLPFSKWESIMICYGESFDSLSKGFIKATTELGGTLPEHRTDNLSAATQKEGSSRRFTERWTEFLDHYHVSPSRNNPGQSHENGSVEKSHDLLKSAINQHLILRGSRNFTDLAAYESFLSKIVQNRNQRRTDKLAEEIKHLQKLPARGWNDPVIVAVKVTPFSTAQILGCWYSVPSRLIGYSLRAYVYADYIDLYHSSKLIIKMNRVTSGNSIDYRHIIDSLVRKPGAFKNYIYRSELFPKEAFRLAYDKLVAVKPETGHKDYLAILQMAKLHGERNVIASLELCEELHILPTKEEVAGHLKSSVRKEISTKVAQPCLKDYDSLYSFKGGSISEVACR